MIFVAMFAGRPDSEVGPNASRLLNDLTGRIEQRLDSNRFLFGDRMTAADITAVPYVYYGMQTAEQATGPLAQFFREHLELGDGRQRTREWVERVLAFDAHPRSVVPA